MAAVRELACRALMRVEQGEKSNEVIDGVLRTAPPADARDRAFFTRLVLETLQNRLFLDAAIDRVSSVKTGKMKPFIRNLLRLSACQLAFFDAVPASAVCSEAVKAAKKNGFVQLSGFVNAVCRKLSQTVRSFYEEAPAAVRYSVPDWIAAELTAQYGKEDAVRMMAAFSGTHAPLTARFHLSKATEREILDALAAQGIRAEKAPYAKNAWYLTEHPAPGRISAFAAGLLQFQDLTSVLASEALDLRPGERVLDLCAAPGGKSVAAADLVGREGRVVSCDKSEAKLARIRENAARCGFAHMEAVQNDATVFRPDWEGAFDAVIADLPCSGLGTMGHKPEIRYRVTPEDVTALAALQRRMLEHAVRYLRPGGRLMFSTCTFTRAENAENTRFLLQSGGLMPLRPAIAPAKEDCALQLMPALYDVSDGFYIACFRRSE